LSYNLANTVVSALIQCPRISLLRQCSWLKDYQPCTERPRSRNSKPLTIHKSRDSNLSPAPFLFQHTLFFLPVFVIASIAILALSLVIPPIYRAIRRTCFPPKYELVSQDEDEEAEEVPSPAPAMPSSGLVADLRNHVRSFKEYGSVLFALEMLRTLCLGALLGLSIWAVIMAESPQNRSEHGLLDILKKKKGRKGHKGHHDKSTLDDYSSLEWGEFGVCGFYVSYKAGRRAARSDD